MTNIEKVAMLEEQICALRREQAPIRKMWIDGANKVLSAEDPIWKRSNFAIPQSAEIMLVGDDKILIEWTVWSHGDSDTKEQTFPVALLEDDASIEKLIQQRKDERETKERKENERAALKQEELERKELARLQEKYK